MAAATTHPLLYEINARQWLHGLSAREGKKIDLASVPEAELEGWSARGFTHVWLMGVWPTGPLSRAEALRHEGLRRAYDEALPGWAEGDVLGSPYAIAAAEVAPALGGDQGLAALRKRMQARGIGLILDFVPNHLGLDHAWVRGRPQVFVSKDGKIAHGKDPYFDPWTDTVQVDYRKPEARAAMTELVRGIAGRCDGVRCDMAMLVLSDVFEKTWGRDDGAEGKRQEAQGTGTGTTEFWAETVAAVKKERPGFLFLAEAYWGLEGRLQELGFDYTYDKTLYDRIVHRQCWDVQPHLLGAGERYVGRSAHFLENHDEPRAAERLGAAEHRAAALLALGLPGLRFLHEGQLEGARRFARIQLRRRAEEPVDAALAATYAQLLEALRHTAVGRGECALLRPEPAWAGNATHRCIVAVQWQHGPRSFDLVCVNLAPGWSQCRVRVTARGVEGRRLAMVDALGTERYLREGNDLRAGLFLDLPGHAAQIFHFEPPPVA